jgi:hypothetical protein
MTFPPAAGRPDPPAPVLQRLSLAEYAQSLTSSGERTLPGAPGTVWVSYDRLAMMRMPFFAVNEPPKDELKRVFWRGPAVVATYYLSPDAHHPGNACLYVCDDRTYGFDKLSPVMRRNVRRGLRELRIETIHSDEVSLHGLQTFLDTLRRNGLQQFSPEEFRRQIALRASSAGHVFVGAWKDNELAAYLSLVDVEDWVEVTSCFSSDAFLQFRPNDALLFFALSRYLVEKKYRAVTFGSSSIQPGSNRMGLHAFKTKVGFEARPVHRAFVVHPLLRPFANRLTSMSVNAVLRFMPHNLRLRKVQGMLECVAGEKESWQMPAGDTSVD